MMILVLLFMFFHGLAGHGKDSLQLPWDFPGWLEANLHQPEPDFHDNRARTSVSFCLTLICDQFWISSPKPVRNSDKRSTRIAFWFKGPWVDAVGCIYLCSFIVVLCVLDFFWAVPIRPTECKRLYHLLQHFFNQVTTPHVVLAGIDGYESQTNGKQAAPSGLFLGQLGLFNIRIVALPCQQTRPTILAHPTSTLAKTIFGRSAWASRSSIYPGISSRSCTTTSAPFAPKTTGLPWQFFNLWWMGALNAIWDIAAGKQGNITARVKNDQCIKVNHLGHELPSQQMVHHHHC